MITVARSDVAMSVRKPSLGRSWMAIAFLMALGEPGFSREPITLVVLPPRGTTALDNKTATAAELLCDQLSKELAGDRELRVVDRTQIEKVLAEKVLDGRQRPALAYNAMLRVTVDPLRAEPAVILEVIDLSTGNIGGSSEWPWTLEPPPGRLREMAKSCRESALKAAAASQRGVKLRLLGVAAPGGMGRLEPMRQHFEQMIEQVVARCPTVCVVRHLEAFTAKEESLLLLLGHARLSEGRQFAPHADRLLAVELAETDSIGKSFEDTVIEIRFRLGRNRQDGDWTRVRGKVSEWSKLAPRACQLLAEQLGQASPETAAQYTADMITRRSQAEAELRAALEHKDKDGKPDLQRVAAAAKLDPTYEPAAYWLVECRQWQVGVGKDTIREALRYLERFAEQPKNRRRVTELAYYSVFQKTPDPQETEMLRKIVDIGMGGGIDGYDPYCGWMVSNVYRGMRAAEFDSLWRMQWLDQVRRRIDVLAAQLEKVDNFHRGNVDSSLLRVRSFLVAFAVEEGEPALARRRLAEFMACGRSVARDQWGIGKTLRDSVAKIGDQGLLQSYDRFLAKLTTPVRQIELTWNDYPVYQKTDVRVKAWESGPMLPMAASPSAVYGVSGTSFREMTGWADTRPARQHLICQPIDAQGRPAEDDLSIDLPKLDKDVAITGAAFLAEKLYVSTKRTGLLVFDVRKESWRQIGLRQGLPDEHVFRICPLDEKTLLAVTGQQDERRTVYCTLNVETGQITLVHRINGKSPLFVAPSRVWWQGDRLMALNYVGLARDVLKTRPEYTPWPDVWPHGWKCRPHTFTPEPTGMVTVGDKRYVMANTGLHQIDDDAKVLRSWGNRLSFYAGGRDHDNLSRDDITTPGDFPDDNLESRYKFAAQSKDHVFLLGKNAEALCYEPASDTWFGPLQLPNVGDDAYPMGMANGVWVGGSRGTVYLRTSDFLDAAKAAGRVMATNDVRRRKRTLAEQAGPFEAAKFDLLVRDFNGARKRAEAILASSPNDPQALLLRAVLDDFWCLNRPEESLQWYRKLSAMDDPSAVYTGLYGEFRINYTLGRWEQAIAAGELLLDKVPCLYAGMTSEIERFMEYARKQRDKAAAQANRSERKRKSRRKHAMKHNGKTRRFGLWGMLAAVLLLVGGPAWAQNTPAPPPATGQAANIPVAVLSAPPGTASSSDMILGELAKFLEAAPGLQVLDRDHVQKLLGEHRLSITGVVRQPVKQGGMLGAKHLLYMEQQQNATARTTVFLCIEVSSGNIVWERIVAPDAAAGADAMEKLASELAGDLRAALAANKRLQGCASATVLSVTNRSQSGRLGFLENSLQGLLEAMLESQGYRALRRHSPGLLAKETVLGISGMVRPDAAALAEAADLVLTASFAESPSLDLPFERTPIRLTLTAAPKGGAPHEHQFVFMLSDMQDLPRKLREAIPPTTKADPNADQEFQRRVEAARLMTELRNLEYIAPLEQHLKQVETARRVIYLDPSARDAYYHLGISLDAQSRGANGKKCSDQPELYRDAAEAFERYLSFTPSDPERVRWAFRYLVFHLGVVNKDNPIRSVEAMARWVRWQHDHRPNETPFVFTPGWFFDSWWEKTPKQRLTFYLWVEELYAPKRFPTVLAEIAEACDQAGDPAKAARYLHDCVALAKPEDGYDRLAVHNARFSLAGSLNAFRPHLTADQYARIEQAFQGRRAKEAATMQAMYGQAYGTATDLYGYYSAADKHRLAKFDCPKAKPEPVALPQPIKHSVIIRLTPAGLWAQGVNAEGKLVLLLSPEPRTWKVVPTPAPMREVPSWDEDAQAHVISIAQLSQEVLFATPSDGIHVYNLAKQSWRRLGTAAGLPSPKVDGMIPDSAHECVWITGGGFLSRYKDGNLYMAQAKRTASAGAAIADADRLLMFFDQPGRLISLDFASQKTTIMLSDEKLRLGIPVPAFFHAPSRGFNAGIYSSRRAVRSNGQFFLVGEYGLMAVDRQGTLRTIWRPDGFFEWNGLGGWVLGNCTLPPCGLKEVIPDDHDPRLLWLVSKHDETIPPYHFLWAKPQSGLKIQPPQDNSQAFITAFCPATNSFSRPVRVDGGFVQMQPRENSIYLTGGNLAHLPKSLWTADQPGQDNDQPPRVERPDTILGRASRALLLGNCADPGPVQSQPAGPICVAVIEPEVLADLPPAERKALGSWLDIRLTESLAKQKDFLLVDRQALDKVLAERAGRVGGLTRIAPNEVAPPLRPFWAAGVLICSRLDAKTQAVIVEAVSAQTGQVLAGIYAKAKVASAEDVAKALGPKMESFGRDIDRGIARLQGKPLLEISGRLASGLSRLAWMVDDLAEAAGAKVAAGDKVALLVPRQPIATKEERLLRVMGLAEAHKGDAAAGLSPVPQIRLSFELADSAKTGVPFEKTPIRLELSLRRGNERASETQIDGEVGQWDACRDKATDWLTRQLTSTGAASVPAADDFQRARQLAAEELAAVAQWTSLTYDQQRDLDRTMRCRVARHALRAAHLEPASEQAAYLVACFVDAIYPREGKEGSELSLAAIDRAIVETQRYLDRFKQTNVEHHRQMLYQLGLLGVKGMLNLAGGFGRKDDILRPPDVRLYPYVNVYVRAWADYGYLGHMDKRYANSSSFQSFSFNLISPLVPCIPDNKLDEEYEYWRTFYATKIDNIVRTHKLTDFLNTRPAPWDLVDAAFQARKKNPQAVREAFQRLAREFPPSQTHVWGGDQWTPPQTPMFLKAAGDPDWRTWRPEFTARQALNIALDEMTRFMHGLVGGSFSSWDLERVSTVPAVQLVAPEEVRRADRERGCTLGDVESLFVVGDDVWLITPASSVGTTRWRNHLFVARMNAPKDGKIILDPVEFPWPQQDGRAAQHPSGVPIFDTSYVTERDGTPTVWIGTLSNGLARFDKAGDKWTARWYAESDGFPANAIDGISSCRSGAQRLILLVSSTHSVRIMPDGSEKPDRATYIWTLNPETNEVKLLLDGSKLKKPLMTPPVAVARDGKPFLLEFLGRGGYDLAVNDIQSFRSSGIWGRAHDLVRDEKGQLRLLLISCDAAPEGDFNRLDELSLETFEPLPTSAGRSGGRYSVFPLPETRWVFGKVLWRSGDYVTLSGRWPAVDGEFARGRGQYFWMGFSSEDAHSGTSRWLVAYRPAAPGAKDWAAKDQWVGPFRVPDNGSIMRMAPYGEESLLLTTSQGMYVVDCRQAISQAISRGNVCSTEQWRSQYEQRLLAAGWKEVLPLLLESRKWDQAAELLEAQRKRLPSTPVGLSTTETHLNLWHAHLLARKGDLPGAVQLYAQVAERAAADRDRPAEVFASMNQIILLFHAGRFQEMLDLCRRVNERFPQTAPEGDDEGLSWYVKEARKKTAAGRPAGSGPAAQPPAATVH